MLEWKKYSGLTNFEQTLKDMTYYVNEMIEARSEGLSKGEKVLLVEHQEVYSYGLSAQPDELLESKDIAVIQTNRGGKYTYHGPGQRVVYPILDLTYHNRAKDVKLYVRKLQQSVIETLSEFGLKAIAIEGKVGVWVEQKNFFYKIAAIGISIKKWITYHGIAVNIKPDLAKYNGILPCGFNSTSVTSMQALGYELDLDQFDLIFKKKFEEIFV